MTERFRTFTALMIVTVLLAAVLITRVSAQGSLATPDAGTSSHPAHIHSGTCAALGDVEFPLEHLTTTGAMASAEASPPLELASTPTVSGSTLTSTTIVDSTLEDLLSHEHAINVHQSEENIETYIACGNTTGTPRDGMLTIELVELNDSGVTGQVILTGNDDFTTTVTIQLTQGTMATPATSTDEMSVAVEVVDFAFNPAELTITAGTTVTWTNVGGQPHTATAEDDSFDTGVLTTDKQSSHTFTEAGTYRYVCTLHESTMQGVIIVT